MRAKNKTHNSQWLPILIIVWNIFDIAIHVRADMVEPLRVSGNIAGIGAALIMWLGYAKSYTLHLSSGAALAVVILNALHASEHGFAIPMLVFIGVALFLLLRWAQVRLNSQNGDAPFYRGRHRAYSVSLVYQSRLGSDSYADGATSAIEVA